MLTEVYLTFLAKAFAGDYGFKTPHVWRKLVACIAQVGFWSILQILQALCAPSMNSGL